MNLRMPRPLVLLALLIGLGGAAEGPVRLGGDLHLLPDGPTVVAAIELRVPPGWHLYWSNPGDSGLPPRLTWTLPPGWTAGPVHFPAPRRLVEAGIITFVHDERLALVVDLSPGPAPTAEARLAVRVDALACALACVPVSIDLAATVPAGPPPPGAAARVAAARAALPRADGGGLSATSDAAAVILAGAGPAPPRHAVFPAAEGVFALDYPPPETVPGGWRQRLPLAPGTAMPERLAGVLAEAAGGRAFDLPVEAPAAAPPPPTAAATAAPSPAPSAPPAGIGLGYALLAGLLGGAILNLMPCVLPVLALKLLAVSRARAAGAPVLGQALGYAAGVLVAYLALAALLLGLRAAGAGVGWGFQLQEPAVVLALAALFLLLAANLAGAFEIGLAATRVDAGRGGAVANGILTVVVATPCGAPFASAALGFAAVAPPAEAFAVFAAMAAGLAAPVLLVTAIPRLAALVPRPGAWTEDLKRILAVPMLGAAGWMLWTFAALAGPEPAFAVLVALVPLLVLAAGAYGRWQATRSRRALAWTLAAAVLVAATAGWVLTHPRPAPSDAAATGSDWSPWSPATEDALRAAGTPMLIDFTAAWCLTCQVNKRTTLRRPEVASAARERGIRLLAADFTARDPAVAAALARHGRASVPTYALIDRTGAATILPDLLTPAIVLDAFATIPPRR